MCFVVFVRMVNRVVGTDGDNSVLGVDLVRLHAIGIRRAEAGIEPRDKVRGEGWGTLVLFSFCLSTVGRKLEPSCSVSSVWK